MRSKLATQPRIAQSHPVDASDETAILTWIETITRNVENCRGALHPWNVDETARTLIDMGRMLAVMQDEIVEVYGGTGTPSMYHAVATSGVHAMRTYETVVTEMEHFANSMAFQTTLRDSLRGDVLDGEAGNNLMVWWRYRGPVDGARPAATALCLAGYATKHCRWRKIHIPRGECDVLLHTPTWVHEWVAKSAWGAARTSTAVVLNEAEGDYLRGIHNHERDWETTIEVVRRLDGRRAGSEARRTATSKAEAKR